MENIKKKNKHNWVELIFTLKYQAMLTEKKIGALQGLWRTTENRGNRTKHIINGWAESDHRGNDQVRKAGELLQLG